MAASVGPRGDACEESMSNVTAKPSTDGYSSTRVSKRRKKRKNTLAATERFTCEFCDEQFWFKRLLEEHMVTDHSQWLTGSKRSRIQSRQLKKYSPDVESYAKTGIHIAPKPLSQQGLGSSVEQQDSNRDTVQIKQLGVALPVSTIAMMAGSDKAGQGDVGGVEKSSQPEGAAEGSDKHSGGDNGNFYCIMYNCGEYDSSDVQTSDRMKPAVAHEVDETINDLKGDESGSLPIIANIFSLQNSSLNSDGPSTSRPVTEKSTTSQDTAAESPVETVQFSCTECAWEGSDNEGLQVHLASHDRPPPPEPEDKGDNKSTHHDTSQAGPEDKGDNQSMPHDTPPPEPEEKGDNQSKLGEVPPLPGPEDKGDNQSMHHETPPLEPEDRGDNQSRLLGAQTEKLTYERFCFICGSKINARNVLPLVTHFKSHGIKVVDLRLLQTWELGMKGTMGAQEDIVEILIHIVMQRSVITNKMFCLFCGVNLSSITHMVEHIKIFHPKRFNIEETFVVSTTGEKVTSSEDRLGICMYCGFSCAEFLELRAHIRYQHGMANVNVYQKALQCSVGYTKTPVGWRCDLCAALTWKCKIFDDTHQVHVHMLKCHLLINNEVEKQAGQPEQPKQPAQSSSPDPDKNKVEENKGKEKTPQTVSMKKPKTLKNPGFAKRKRVETQLQCSFCKLIFFDLEYLKKHIKGNKACLDFHIKEMKAQTPHTVSRAEVVESSNDVVTLEDSEDEKEIPSKPQEYIYTLGNEEDESQSALTKDSELESSSSQAEANEKKKFNFLITREDATRENADSRTCSKQRVIGKRKAGHGGRLSESQTSPIKKQENLTPSTDWDAAYSDRKFICDFCKRRFKQKHHLKKHLSRIHFKDMKGFKVGPLC